MPGWIEEFVFLPFLFSAQTKAEFIFITQEEQNLLFNYTEKSNSIMLKQEYPVLWLAEICVVALQNRRNRI